jgi:hypothetical protein
MAKNGLERASGERFAILSVDLDHFKEANDSYGHLIGDALLPETGRDAGEGGVDAGAEAVHGTHNDDGKSDSDQSIFNCGGAPLILTEHPDK